LYFDAIEVAKQPNKQAQYLELDVHSALCMNLGERRAAKVMVACSRGQRTTMS